MRGLGKKAHCLSQGGHFVWRAHCHFSDSAQGILLFLVLSELFLPEHQASDQRRECAKQKKRGQQ